MTNQRSSGRIHQQNCEEFGSIASYMTEAASTRRCTDTSSKQLKHPPSAHFLQQNRDRSESSLTDMTMTGAAAATRRTIISSRHSKQPPLDRIHNHERFQSSGIDMTSAAAKPLRTFIYPKKSLYGLSGHIVQQKGPQIESPDESSEDGDAEGTGGLDDTIADRHMPPRNAEPRSGNHQDCVTNIIDIYSSTDTSSTVSPSISRKKWDVRKKHTSRWGYTTQVQMKLSVPKEDTPSRSDYDYLDSGFSDNNLCESFSGTPSVSTSHFRLPGDDSDGFDNHEHTFKSIPKESLESLYGTYGENTVGYEDPVVINNSNIDDICWKKYYPIKASNIFLVIEGSPKTGCSQVGTNEAPLDHQRWKKRETSYLICIAPPDRGCCQSYLLYKARECHYESYGNAVIESIRGTELSILFFPAGGINTRSAHCYVINEQHHLAPFASQFKEPEAINLIKTYQTGKEDTEHNKRHVSPPADFGICSTFVFLCFFSFSLLLLYCFSCCFF